MANPYCCNFPFKTGLQHYPEHIANNNTQLKPLYDNAMQTLQILFDAEKLRLVNKKMSEKSMDLADAFDTLKCNRQKASDHIVFDYTLELSLIHI